ncbi:DUF4912 domain-containing protein [Brevibacillus composti]|uniref:DUF4912 domain-containing protein n=1 Tax=Brevibacillus composti TaxID=2796470 RepID=A0A7T5ENN3_9BACL|nr:DUF4912 domain-containing protein [Brevibacillus composti]QQE75949.1 DUF4912 domain-containing protein [Brevibacillus composti]QUO42975.1 DUF4912 domain-containing protein [Brevibacillus composti]
MQLPAILRDHRYSSTRKKSPFFTGIGNIQTMVKGCNSVHIAWEISEARLRMIAAYLPPGTREIAKGLRVFDAVEFFREGRIPAPYLDVPVTGDERDCTLRNLPAGRMYLVDFGLFHDRKFCPILRSDTFWLPDTGRSGEGAEASSKRASTCRYSLPYKEHPVLLA